MAAAKHDTDIPPMPVVIVYTMSPKFLFKSVIIKEKTLPSCLTMANQELSSWLKSPQGTSTKSCLHELYVA